jgi:predicted nucleotidyltransferase
MDDMRLQAKVIDEIKQAFNAQFGEGTLYLFGSRLDDQKRGGDIDLLLDFAEPVDNPALLAAQFSAKVSRLVWGRKVDVLIWAPNLKRTPIHDVAFAEGVRL